MSYAFALTRAEIQELSRVNTLRGVLAVAFDFATIAAIACLFERFAPGWLYPLALIGIGTRLNSLGVHMHEAAHYRIAKPIWLNDLIGEVLLSWPFFFTLEGYRGKHLDHHQNLNTAQDPDWARKQLDPTYWRFPRSQAQMLGLLLVDLSGLHFFKFYAFIRSSNRYAGRRPTSR